MFEDWACIAKTMNHFTEQLKYFNSALQCFPRKVNVLQHKNWPVTLFQRGDYS